MDECDQLQSDQDQLQAEFEQATLEAWPLTEVTPREPTTAEDVVAYRNKRHKPRLDRLQMAIMKEVKEENFQ